MKEADQYQIGELATRLQLNPKTIRYYERIGLLPEPRRTPAGYRLYDSQTVARLEFILKAKQIGLSLAEIHDVLSLKDNGQKPCQHVLSLVEQKVAMIDKQLRILGEMRGELLSLKDEAAKDLQCTGNICSLIEAHASLNKGFHSPS
jgi:DNA-binding transcriptional MerR regulator